MTKEITVENVEHTNHTPFFENQEHVVTISSIGAAPEEAQKESEAA